MVGKLCYRVIHLVCELEHEFRWGADKFFSHHLDCPLNQVNRSIANQPRFNASPTYSFARPDHLVFVEQSWVLQSDRRWLDKGTHISRFIVCIANFFLRYFLQYI